MRVLISAWAGSTNLGDELIQAALVAKLEARGCAVASVSIDPSRTRTAHGIGAVDHRDPIGVWVAIEQADALVFGGGGIVQDLTSALNLPYHLARPASAAVRRTPWAGIGLGVGPMVTTAGRRLTGRVLRGAIANSVRDQESADLLARFGVPGSIVAADLAFGLPPSSAEPADALVCCLRPWTGGGRLPVARQGGRTPHWQVAAAARALDAASSRTGLPVRMVALQADRDGPLQEQVASAMRRPVTCATPGLASVVDEVARSRAVISMRYHGAVAALLGGRPTVTIGYTPKVDALADELGAGGAGVAFSPEGFAAIPDAVGTVLDHEEAAREARELLRSREAGNDRAIDLLLDAAQRYG